VRPTESEPTSENEDQTRPSSISSTEHPQGLSVEERAFIEALAEEALDDWLRERGA